MLRRALLVLALVGAVAGPLSPVRAQAVDSSTKRGLETDIQRAQSLLHARQRQIQSITAALGTTASELQAKIRQRDAVSKELSDLRAQQAQLQQQLTALEAQRASTEAKLKGLNQQLATLKQRIAVMLVNLYQQRVVPFADSLAQSKTLHQFQVNNYYLSLLTKQDVDVIQQLDRLLAQLRQVQQQLTTEVAAVTSKQAAIAANAKAREQKRAQLVAVIAGLQKTHDGQLAQKQALLQEQNQIETNLQDLNQQLKAEVARLQKQEAAARAAAARYARNRDKQLQYQHQADEARARLDALAAPEKPLSTGFVMPLDKGKIVSRFGEGNNSYIAIKAPVPNAAVRSVQAGTVVAISYLGANFGYMVAVQHGGGLTTVYTNLRKPVIQLYDAVKRGQVLGYLGGGTLSNDLLPFYARTDAGGKSAFINPAPLFGK